MRTQALKWELFAPEEETGRASAGLSSDSPRPRFEPAGPGPGAEADAAGAAGETPDRMPAQTPAGPEPLESRLARARGEGRAAGFEEGVAHAEAAGQAELRVLLSDLREALQDAVHARLEREAAAVAAARRLAHSLLAGVAPALARRGLAAEVADAAGEALRAAGAGAEAPALQVRVAPGQAEAVRAALAGAGLCVPVAPEPGLTDLRARLEWGGGVDELDLDDALAAARAALDRHLPESMAGPEEGSDPPEPERRAAHA